MIRWQSVVVSILVLLTIDTGTTKAGDPITVVVLSPHGTTALDDKTAVAAELLCDQLTEELARDPSLRVVDRSQIDRVLAEQAIGDNVQPVLAYDAMVRIVVDPLQAEPAVTLRVVDLSSGNIAGARS